MTLIKEMLSILVPAVLITAIITVISDSNIIYYLDVFNSKSNIDNYSPQEAYKYWNTISRNIPEKVFYDYSDMEEFFYKKLKTCTPCRLRTKGVTTSYVIYGRKDEKCSFKTMFEVEDFGKMQSFNFYYTPMNITRKYANDGLELVKTLRKSGFAQPTKFMSEISDNPKYCAWYNY